MAFQLNSRCLDILHLLLASDGPVSAAQIADRLDISPRMVRSSLAPARRWLAQKEVVLRSVPGMGISLAGTREAKKRLARLVRDCDRPVLWLAPSERLHVVLLTLFFAATPPQVKQLEETIDLSRSTTLRVLDTAAQWLRKRGLRLVRRQNRGSWIEGSELDWRRAVVDLLHESAGEAVVLARLQGTTNLVDASSPGRTGLQQALQAVWQKLELPAVKASLYGPQNGIEHSLSDQDYLDLLLHLALMIYRGRSGKSPSASVPARPMPGSRPGLAAQLADCVHARFGVLLTESEMAWIEDRIGGSHALPEKSGVPGSTASDAAGRDRRVRLIVDDILSDASLALHPSLSADVDLDLNLSMRLHAMLEPGQQGQELSAPLLQNVRAQYPYVYSTARESSSRLLGFLGRPLDENEIGEIAVCLVAAMERLRHSDRPTRKVLVVCGEGAVTAWLLVSRLRAEFPDVEVVGVVSALELESRANLDNIDFIVSTIPLKVKTIPSRQVGPLLGLSDCRALKELFGKRPDGEALAHEAAAAAPHLKDLLTPRSIDLGVTAQTWQEVVEQAGGRMVQAGLVEPRFVDAMKQVIVEHGPYMVTWPGVVLLHAPPHGIRQLSMRLINLREPVCFGHAQNDPVRVAVVLAATGSRLHITALLELNRMMQDEQARSAISSTIHKSVVLHWVSAYSK